jgi:alpha-glucosidase (family GH31 glycosyl hydrolase)
MCLLAFIKLPAQVAWLTPVDPSPTDTVVLTFNQNEGNKGLEGWEGTVYLHTGAITERSIDGGDWKHVTGNWGEDDQNVKMTPLGNGLHQFTFVINDYYRLRDEEVVQQLSFVFRNLDGSKVGKTAKNEDIFVPVNGYVPPVKQAAVYLFNDRKLLSYKKNGSNLSLQTEHGTIHIIPFSEKIIQVKHFESDEIITDSSDAVIMKPKLILTRLEETDDRLRFSTDSITVIINKNPFYLSYLYNGDTILTEDQGFFKRTDNNGLRFKIQNREKLYGLGERAVDFNLVGNKYNLYNRPKYGYELPALNLNYSVPLVISSKKYLLFFDNPQKGYADIGEAEPNIFEWGAIGGLMKYFVLAGYDYYDIMYSWGRLTGNQPLPPRWALGNLQSRIAYRNEKETDSIVGLMQEKNFPIDAIILDFYWFGDSISGTMGRLDWYKPNWPEPEKMIASFSKRGVKTILITEPYIIDSLKNFEIADELGILATDQNGDSYVNKGFYFGPGALIDIFQPRAQQWFWGQYQTQINKGVAGWWGDLGEPENHPADQIHVSGTADEIHNVYAQYWHKMLYENYREHYPGKRLFNLNRAGYAGSQRYAVYPWTGDVSRSWGGLQAQLPAMLHMSMSGLPFIHSDAGGFAQGTKDDELYTRWLQFACFTPILRPHGSGIPSEPVYFSAKTQTIVRDFMHLRYRLLPYIYTTAAQAKVRGYPIVRPLFFDYPTDSLTYSLANEYMFGDRLLVAPIIQKGQQTIDVYLPGKRWYSLWDETVFDGGKWHTFETELKTIPVFVKEGSLIPMVKAVNSTDDYSSAELTIRYYPGQSGDSSFYNMFEDDGKTYGSIGWSEYEYLRFKAIRPNEMYLKIEMFRDGWDYRGMPKKRIITLEIVNQYPGLKQQIMINGKKIKAKSKKDVLPSYTFENNYLVIKFEWDGTLTRIEITQ